MSDELRLPRAGEAVVSPEKLRDYVLSPTHPIGRHKARVFMSALGIGQDDWRYLREQILELVDGAPVVTLSAQHPFGTIYSVVLVIEGLNGASHQVMTGWIVEEDEPPRLTSAYVNVP